MSTTKTITLSMESLNKLYFQFFDRFVTPNLPKTITEITQLLRHRTAYEVYKYLDELFARGDNHEGYTSNQVISTLNASLPALASLPAPAYQYALPTNEHPKSAHSDHLKPFDKDKALEDSITFKNKLGIRRTLTGLAFEDLPNKPFEFRNYSDEASQSPSVYTNPALTNPPVLSTDWVGEEERGRALGEERGRALKEIVRKIGKVFNDNHGKIEKYNKNSAQSNKLFNINTSTRLEKKEEGRKEYQFLTKADLHARKY